QDFDAAWSVFSLLNEEPKRPFVAAVEITAIKKIGKKAKKVLNAAGIFTLKELSQIEVEDTSKLHEALVSSDLSVEKLEELRDEARKILENSGGWKLLFGTKNE
ncbi:MAG TPA: hypothetical protein VJ044_04950, partial [Candidatus Hodarchaeales archaeon]|nr:hypothetical protein [Candidatus Hodarchaeales archaeon]